MLVCNKPFGKAVLPVNHGFGLPSDLRWDDDILTLSYPLVTWCYLLKKHNTVRCKGFYGFRMAGQIWAETITRFIDLSTRENLSATIHFSNKYAKYLLVPASEMWIVSAFCCKFLVKVTPTLLVLEHWSDKTSKFFNQFDQIGFKTVLQVTSHCDSAQKGLIYPPPLACCCGSVLGK